MTRPSKPGSTTSGPMVILTFILGMGIGLVLVAPAIPSAAGQEFQEILRAGGAVILVGMAAFAAVLVVLAILYRLYLRA